jgi:hypothetical protein
VTRCLISDRENQSELVTNRDRFRCAVPLEVAALADSADAVCEIPDDPQKVTGKSDNPSPQTAVPNPPLAHRPPPPFLTVRLCRHILTTVK